MKRTEHISPQTRRIAKAVAPLSAADGKRAIARATAYLRPELTRGGHSRFRVLGAELSLTRSDSKTAPVRRQIEVLIVDYLNRRHLRVAIEGSRVAEVRDLAGQPAYAADEIKEARGIAVRAPELAALTQARGVFVDAFAPGQHLPGERRIGLRFLMASGDEPAAALALAEVDLIDERLLGYELTSAGRLIGQKRGKHGRVR